MSKNAVVIIGGSLAGIQAALEQAKAGKKVYLVEKCPSIDGKRLLPHSNLAADSPFSTPDPAELKGNSNIEVITNADVEEVDGVILA